MLAPCQFRPDVFQIQFCSVPSHPPIFRAPSTLNPHPPPTHSPCPGIDSCRASEASHCSPSLSILQQACTAATLNRLYMKKGEPAPSPTETAVHDPVIFLTCRAVAEPSVVVAVPDLVALIRALFGPPGRRFKGKGSLAVVQDAPVAAGQAALTEDARRSALSPMHCSYDQSVCGEASALRLMTSCVPFTFHCYPPSCPSRLTIISPCLIPPSSVFLISSHQRPPSAPKPYIFVTPYCNSMVTQELAVGY